jgi:hypothetical protein
MMIGDFSPPPLPSLKQLRDVLGKVLDRTAPWAYHWQLNGDQLWETCLRDHLLDTQIEPSGKNRSTYRHGGRDYRLTDVAGNVVRKILA